MWMTPEVGGTPALSTEFAAVLFQSITGVRGAERNETVSASVALFVPSAPLEAFVPDALQPEIANPATSTAVARVSRNVIESPFRRRADRAHVQGPRSPGGARSRCQCRDPRHCLLPRCACSGRRHRRTRLQVTLRNRRGD